jgi:hypothetical protein
MSDNYVEEICKTSRMTLEEITTKYKSTLKLLNIIGEQAIEIERLKKGHIANVMSSRFDEEIEKVMSMVEWSDQRDRKMVLDLFKKMQTAILHQKISET